MELPDERKDKPLNSFQLLGGLLAAAVGIRSGRRRGRGFSDASTASVLGAILIFCALTYGGAYAFVHAIKAAVAN